MDNTLIPGYPQGSDISLINTTLFRGSKQPDGKWSKDIMTIVYRDNISGEKKVHEIVDPLNDYYVRKPEFSTTYNEFFAPIEQLDHFVVNNRGLEKDIAKQTGNMDFYSNNIANGNWRANQLLHKDPRVFFSDMNIEDKYRFYFSQQYKNEISNPTKAFLDIEADIIDMAGDFPEMGECPINAVSIVCQEQKTIFTLLLRDKDNPQCLEFEQGCKDGSIITELRDFVCENVGGPQAFHNFGLDEYNYKILFYDEEINLIADIFRLINSFNPDFVLAWNMAFDIPYIIARIQVLGFDPAGIMCSDEFSRKEVRYFIDERVKDEYAERGDFCTISSCSVYLDQMLQFASRRKGQTAFSSFSLDNIGGIIAKVNKVDYKDITPSLAKLPRLNYKVFVFYNIFDTIVQHCVECVVGDIDYVYSKCIQNNTRYSKCHRQTVYLTNRAAEEFYKLGYVLGNNANRGSDKPNDDLPGAYVADPRRLNDYSKIVVAGHPIYVFDNNDDFDYKALYPSIAREFNIAPNTQIGKIILPDQIHDKENLIMDPKFNRAGKFMEDLHSHSWLEFCERYFKLAGYVDLFDDIMEYFTHHRMPANTIRPYDINGYIKPIEFFSDGIDYVSIDENSYDDTNYITPILFFQEQYPEVETKEFINNAKSNPNQQFLRKED